MATTIDELQIEINAKATKANDAIDRLVTKLDRLSTSFSGINGGSLVSLANGVERLGNAMQTMNGIKTADFTRLASNLTKLGNINTGAINSAASSMQRLTTSFNSLGTVSANAQQIGDLAKNIAKLGNKSVQTAISNMPQLATAINNLMRSLSTAPKVSQNLIQMTNALANFTSQGGKIGSASNNLINGLTRIGKTAHSTSFRFRGLASAIGKFYATYFLVIRGIKGLWSAIRSSMDYIETLNYFNAAFGQVADTAVKNWKEAGYDSADAYYNSFADRAKQLTSKMTGFTITESGMLQSGTGKSLGINPNQLMQYQAVFGQMASSIGLSAENSTRLSIALTEIGADLASVKNMDFDKVWKDMQSGLAGMSRTLDKYGVNIRNVNLQQKLTELGIHANIQALNQNEKAMLRTIILLDSTKYAWGDLAETLNKPANQLRLLKANFGNLARTIGNIFLPIVAKVLPYINMLVVALQRLAEFIVKLLGFEGFDWGGASGIGGAGLEDLVDESDDLASGLDSASKSAKKLKANLQGFDELNVITTQDDTSGGGAGAGALGGGAGLLDAALTESLKKYQDAWDEAFSNLEARYDTFAESVKNAFQTGGLEGVGAYFSSELTKALEGIPWEKIYSGAATFGTGFADFLNGLITPELFSSVGGTIAGALNTAIVAALNFGEGFDWTNLGNSIAAGINRFFKDFKADDLAKTINAWVIGIVDAGIALLDGTDFEFIGKKIGTFISEIDFSKITIKLLNFGGKLLSAMVDAIIGLAETAPIETAIIGLFAAMKFTGLSSTLSTGISNALAVKGLSLGKIAIGFSFGLATLKFMDSDSKIQNLIAAPLSALLATFTFTHDITLGLKVAAVVFSFEAGFNLGKAIGDWISKKIESENMDKYRYNFKFSDLFSYSASEWGQALSEWASDLKKKLTDKWGSVKSWWGDKVLAIKTSVDNIKSNLSAKWTEARTWWNNSKASLSQIVPKVYSIRDRLKTAWDNARKWWNNNKPSLSEILAKIKLPHIKISWETEGNIAKYMKMLGFKGFPSFSVSYYAQGGFPEDGWFRASHGEIMGKFDNGKSVVANNLQITEGISQAVQSGNQQMVSIMQQELYEAKRQNELLMGILQKEFGISQNDIGRAARNYSQEYYNRTGQRAYT